MKNADEHFGQAVLTTNFLVNTFPTLARLPDWLPWMDWKRTAKEWKNNKDYAVDAPFFWAKSQIALPQHEPSMVESILEQTQRMGLSPSEVDDYTKEIAAIMFAAGIDTFYYYERFANVQEMSQTSNAILVFFMAMILLPKTQQKAQAEIDTMIGSERLPEMEDRPRLVYVERMVREVLRWRPITPIAVPHACYQDNEYKGYRIPKGAIVIGNTWAMSHNPLIYKDPDTFNPDRFLDPSVQPAPSFGFGRRMCPGLHFAQSSLFIFIASILATFNIEMAKDEHGNNVPPADECEPNLLYHPTPFKLKLTPRSSAHEQLIHAGA
ncbi:hypothetical protein FRC09_013383 [Ceratobasidium sp. 395]|nr:hypothetical protein FRC09_013383 [Ceratobasidium sp. 395]